MTDARTRARLFIDQCKEEAVEMAESAMTPAFLRDHVEGVTRAGQVIAFLFLGPVVIISLRLIVVLNQLLTDIFAGGGLSTNQEPIFAWLITLITAGAYVVSAWMWFQFVRTGGFGWFAWDQDRPIT